ncbi:MAG TPA: tryptophan synthase subunit alpha [Burkholderiaceae bacterium]|nr:tryptophan synthase subunit alpha [Burkholderiaceae bacterium]
MPISSSRLDSVFQRAAGRTALIPYVTAGDPSISATVPLLHALVAAGADVLELGVPFSEPMADGPVIQRASQRAIDRGVGLRQVLSMVAEFRRGDANTPVVLMGYANPIEHMGQAAFARAAAEAGVDGVLVVDYPPEEITDFTALLETAGIAPIFLLAPTSTLQRIEQVARCARGYVYYVSLKGVTGAGHLDTSDVQRRVAELRNHLSVPIGVGFGIRDADSACRVAEFADAVVIGTRLIETIEAAVEAAGKPASTESDSAAIAAAAAWLGGIRAALDRA